MKKFLSLMIITSILSLFGVMVYADSDKYYDPYIYDDNHSIIGYIDENGREIYNNGVIYDGEVDDPYGYEEYYGYDVAYSAGGWNISSEGYVVNADFNQVAVKIGGKYKIVLPQSVDGHKVIGLADEWLMLEYEDMPNVEIYIPSTITFIAENALHNGPVCMPDEHPMYFYEKGSYAEKFFNEYNEDVVKSTMNASQKFRTVIVGNVEKVDVNNNKAANAISAGTPVGSVKSDNSTTSATNDNKAADDDIKVILNGAPLSFTQSPVIENGTTLVPMRAIFEAMGASVDWNADTKTVTSVKGNTTISLTLYSSTAKVNEEKITLAVPGKLINGSTMMPLRFVSESLGAEVKWDGTNKTITIVNN